MMTGIKMIVIFDRNGAKKIYQDVINVRSISLLGGGYRYVYICKYLSSSLHIN